MKNTINNKEYKIKPSADLSRADLSLADLIGTIEQFEDKIKKTYDVESEHRYNYLAVVNYFRSLK